VNALPCVPEIPP